MAEREYQDPKPTQQEKDQLAAEEAVEQAVVRQAQDEQARQS